jgi:hypothetical protein
VSAQTGIAPLDLRDTLVEDEALFDELVDAADRWTPQLELDAVSAELLHELLRVVITLGGGRAPAPLAIPRQRSLAAKPRVVSVVELAQLTSPNVARGGDVAS